MVRCLPSPLHAHDYSFVTGVNSIVSKLQTKGVKDYACGLDAEGLGLTAQLMRERAIQQLEETHSSDSNTADVKQKPIKAVRTLNKLLAAPNSNSNSNLSGHASRLQAFVDDPGLRERVCHGVVKLSMPFNSKSSSTCAEIVRGPSRWPERFRRGRE